MKKFSISKEKKELIKILDEYKIGSQSALVLLINNMELYNKLLDRFQGEDDVKLHHLIIQLNGQILKQQKEFKLTPGSIKEKVEEEEEDAFTFIKKNIEKRNAS